jgi:elongator complex protein 1
VWHRSNWHWYLKQEFSFAAAGAAGVQACWDDQLPMQLHMLCANGSYNTVTFLWDTCVSARGTTLVADGHRLLITPLR